MFWRVSSGDVGLRETDTANTCVLKKGNCKNRAADAGTNKNLARLPGVTQNLTLKTCQPATALLSVGIALNSRRDRLP